MRWKVPVGFPFQFQMRGPSGPWKEEEEVASAAVFSLFLGFYRRVAAAELSLEPGERAPIQALYLGRFRDASQLGSCLSRARSLWG